MKPTGSPVRFLLLHPSFEVIAPLTPNTWEAKPLATTTSRLPSQGDVESLRPRLLDALQKLGYTVLGEQPIYAKRGAQGGARSECWFEVLDYPTRLGIALDQINDFAVVITTTSVTTLNMAQGRPANAAA